MAHLFIDPGFRAIGIAIYDVPKDNILDVGTLVLDKKVYDRDKKIHGSSKADAHYVECAIKFLNDWSAQHLIEWVGFELPHGGMSFRAVKMLSIISGAVIGWAIAHELPICYYTPGFNKKCATGDTRATKELVAMAVHRRWPLPMWSELDPKISEHIYDAAALIIAAKTRGDI